jgi:hypothetical protein
MQKVVGSSPVIRFLEPLETAGFFMTLARSVTAAWQCALRCKGQEHMFAQPLQGPYGDSGEVCRLAGKRGVNPTLDPSTE